jgi:hypothetical protein
MLNKIHKHFGHIIYYDEPHKYFHKVTKKPLISATTVIGEYSEPFDTAKWSLIKAKERNIPVEAILKEW